MIKAEEKFNSYLEKDIMFWKKMVKLYVRQQQAEL